MFDQKYYVYDKAKELYVVQSVDSVYLVLWQLH